MSTTYTPDGLFEVSTTAGLAEGERRRDAAHDLLRDRRAVYVRRGQRALLARLLDTGTATADDVAAVVELPPDIDGRCLGAVPGVLAKQGLIQALSADRSRRPTRHASLQITWRLVNAAEAWQWLAAHPDLSNPADDRDDYRQLTITFDQHETPTGDAAGVSQF